MAEPSQSMDEVIGALKSIIEDEKPSVLSILPEKWTNIRNSMMNSDVEYVDSFARSDGLKTLMSIYKACPIAEHEQIISFLEVFCDPAVNLVRPVFILPIDRVHALGSIFPTILDMCADQMRYIVSYSLRRFGAKSNENMESTVEEFGENQIHEGLSEEDGKMLVEKTVLRVSRLMTGIFGTDWRRSLGIREWMAIKPHSIEHDEMGDVIETEPTKLARLLESVQKYCMTSQASQQEGRIIHSLGTMLACISCCGVDPGTLERIRFDAPWTEGIGQIQDQCACEQCSDLVEAKTTALGLCDLDVLVALRDACGMETALTLLEVAIDVIGRCGDTLYVGGCVIPVLLSIGSMISLDRHASVATLSPKLAIMLTLLNSLSSHASLLMNGGKQSKNPVNMIEPSDVAEWLFGGDFALKVDPIEPVHMVVDILRNFEGTVSESVKWASQNSGTNPVASGVALLASEFKSICGPNLPPSISISSTGLKKLGTHFKKRTPKTRKQFEKAAAAATNPHRERDFDLIFGSREIAENVPLICISGAYTFRLGLLANVAAMTELVQNEVITDACNVLAFFVNNVLNMHMSVVGSLFSIFETMIRVTPASVKLLTGIVGTTEKSVFEGESLIYTPLRTLCAVIERTWGCKRMREVSRRLMDAVLESQAEGVFCIPELWRTELSGFMSSLTDISTNSETERICAQCGAHDADKRCGGCGGPYYCSRDCQKLHWKAGHKLECKKD